MKLYNKIACLLVSSGMVISCSYDEGPAIEDHFLNYEIPEIPLTADCPVGVFYYNNGSGGVNAGVWERTLEQPDPLSGKVGPWVEPVLGNYTTNPSDESVAVFQQQVDWCIEGGIDFLVLPGCREMPDSLYPKNIVRADTAFYNIVTGRIGSDSQPREISNGPVVDMKSLKYVISVNLDEINSGLSNATLIENVPSTIREGVERTRIERFNDFFKRISDYFSDPNYYKVNGKPIVVLLNAQNLYSGASDVLYDNMRAYVKAHSGYDLFLIAQQNAWTPPARFEYFFIKGKVDAVTHKNMYEQNQYARSYWYPQAIDQNWIYSREFFMNNWNIDYVPTIAPSYYGYVNSGANLDQPIVPKAESTFRTMCNVAKKNLGNTRIVLINSFNYWQLGTTLEPTIPEYGNGYGTTYLHIVKEQFKN